MATALDAPSEYVVPLERTIPSTGASSAGDQQPIVETVKIDATSEASTAPSETGVSETETPLEVPLLGQVDFDLVAVSTILDLTMHLADADAAAASAIDSLAVFLERNGADAIVAVANDILRETRALSRDSSLAMLRLVSVATPSHLTQWTGWLLTSALRSADAYVREAAVVGLVNLDDSRYRENLLVAAKREPEPVVRDGMLAAAALW